MLVSAIADTLGKSREEFCHKHFGFSRATALWGRLLVKNTNKGNRLYGDLINKIPFDKLRVNARQGSG